MTKFDETDRKKVVREFEKEKGISLSRAGNRRKAFVTEDGKPYWIVGGYKDWHGIPNDMMEDVLPDGRGGRLIFAARKAAKMRVFEANLQPLIIERKKLRRNERGDFQFELRWIDDRPSIRQVPACKFQFLFEFPYVGDEKEGDKNVEGAMKMVDKMSASEREAFLKTIENKRE